ncbi:MAG TPA: P-II family nitrogen regulator [Cellvibrio sp.]|nr:P-II family nitrogen regulator [Cellvibrio sp.]
MKLVTAFLHHVRVIAVVDALNDAGYRNLTLQDVKGTLSPLDEFELTYSSEARVIISEVKLSLVCEDAEVERIANLIREAGEIGTEICGWVYVSAIEQALPIGGSIA